MKHYTGRPAVASDVNHAFVGQLEQVDLEDGSVSIKSGSESHWFDGGIVNPSLKKFKYLTTDDILEIVDEMIFNGRKISWKEVSKISTAAGVEWESETVEAEFGVYIYLIDNSVIHITNTWSVIGLKGFDCPVDNIGKIIFFICELDYDVTGDF